MNRKPQGSDEMEVDAAKAIFKCLVMVWSTLLILSILRDYFPFQI